MAAQQGVPTSPLRALEEALGMGSAAGGDASDMAEGTYYLERILPVWARPQAPAAVTGIRGQGPSSPLGGALEAWGPDSTQLELKLAFLPPKPPYIVIRVNFGSKFCVKIPDDNFSIPEGEEDLAKAIQMVQEQDTDTQILEQKTVLPSKHVVPEVIEDFLCNFLIKMGMTRTLDCFQSEWYELIQKGVTKLKEAGDVPDVYTQNMVLENENRNLKKDLKHWKQAADKAREDLLKTQKERDFHRMHHKRVIQEKNKLINELKGMKLHYASYEPTIRVLLDKHHTLLRQKMLTSMERDRAVEQDSEFPTDMQPSPDLCLPTGNDSPAKFDYQLSTIFRLHDLPVSW
ncbi:Sperm-associated antigen 16 protein [Myotis brandtii]|uniref:Sperm-associated antigen 16 protein n=1 Tax=Myotis brandtii TaxID=109478 RepID=S7NJT2_MYOBR|nr:Sperm-associated antigen 16 protein [Myotis brandtii]